MKRKKLVEKEMKELLKIISYYNIIFFLTNYSIIQEIYSTYVN